MRIGIVIGLLAGATFTYGQTTVSGRVVNAKSKEALPFVNIGILGTLRGTATDIDGRFEIRVHSNDTLILSYVGFRKKKIAGKDLPSFTLIELEEKSTDLRDVVIRPGENPAWKIIRRVIANKPINDPDNLNSFSYNCYNKLFGTMIDPNTDPGIPSMDTSKARKFFVKNHLFVFESYTKRYFKKPNQIKEIIIGNKMTGIKDPFFSLIATDVQSFSMYPDYIKLFDKNYINPISKGFESRYDMVLEDTILYEQDSTYIISFKPYEGKSFDALQGQLHITTDGYALKHVIIEPADPHALIAGTVHHQYTKINGHWFPSQLNTDLNFKQFGVGNMKLRYISRSYITNVEINPDLDNSIFGTLSVEFENKANFRDSVFWKANRTDTLSLKDRNTLVLYDSIEKKLNYVNIILKGVEALAIGKFRAGPFNFPLPNILKFNQYESVRVGWGLETNSRLSKIFSLNGYAGYGIQDKAFKYGGGLQLKFPLRRETILRLNWSRDIAEPGSTTLLNSPVIGNETFRHWAAARMDSVESYKIDLALRPITFSEVHLLLQKEVRNPTYTYHYSAESIRDSSFTITMATVQFRYAVGERYTQIRDSKFVSGLEYPQFYVSATKSISGIYNGEFDFTKVEARIDHRFLLGGFGKTLISLQGGIANGKIPYPYLFNGKGSRLSGSVNGNVLINNYFQTMGLYEFVGDRYAYFFLNHNFGLIVDPKHKTFRPELSILHNMAYGGLKNISEHQNLVFNTLEKGYLESGLLLNNIFRFTYAKLFYLGIGGGAFYRYGAYTLPNTMDNFAFKFSLSLSF